MSDTQEQLKIVAEGLAFPEGPIAMPDGSVILVEIKRGTITRVWNGKTEIIATPGGGPNGAALGPDGALYEQILIRLAHSLRRRSSYGIPAV